MPLGPGVVRHRVRHGGRVAMALGLVLPVCAQSLSAQEAAPKGQLAPDVATFSPAPDLERPQVPPSVNPTGPLSLSQALELSLRQSPLLAAYSWEIRAREAERLQARRLPNPVASLLLEDLGARQFAGGGINEPIQPQATIELSQVIELGGKRAARRELASANRDLATWDFETARIDVLTHVHRAFIDVLTAQDLVAQLVQTSALADQMQQTVASRVQAGDVSPIEETRATVAASSVRIELARARRLLDGHRHRLARIWGSDKAAFSGAEGVLADVASPPPTLALLAARLSRNPELARWSTEVVQREALLSVERSKSVPDISLVGGYRRYTSVDANAWVVGASIPLPLFDRNRGAIQAANTRVVKAEQERRAAEVRVGEVLAEAHTALTVAYEEAEALRNSILPGSQQAFEAVSEGYRLGRFGLPDVLETQRVLFAARSQRLRALSDYHKAVATIERLIGASLREPAPTTPNE